MYTKNIVWLSVLLMLAVSGHAIGAQSISGTVEIESSGSIIVTVLGCMETFLCQGEGSDIRWRFFGTRNDLTNTSTRQVTVTRDESTGIVSSLLTFTNVQSIHEETYTCNIVDSDTRNTVTLSAQLIVNNTRAFIVPVANIDISGITIGSNISIGCSVQTCEEQLTVNILRGSEVLRRTEFTNRNNAIVNRDLVVSESIVGMYECMVMLSDGVAIRERFNITGTPLQPTTPPSTMPPSNGGNPTRNSNGATSLYGVQVPLLFLVVSLSVYLTNAKL